MVFASKGILGSLHKLAENEFWHERPGWRNRESS